MAELEPGTVLAPVDVAAVLAAHVPWPDGANGCCSYCGSPEPCVTRRLAEELIEALGGLALAHDVIRRALAQTAGLLSPGLQVDARAALGTARSGAITPTPHRYVPRPIADPGCFVVINRNDDGTIPADVERCRRPAHDPVHQTGGHDG